MSRVGKKPITIPADTTVSYQGKTLSVKGKRGKLERLIHPDIDIAIEGGILKVLATMDDRKNYALQGLTRSLIANMITGVTRGMERVLEINGIGYRAALSGNRIEFSLGYSHPVFFDLPEGVSASIDKNNTITLSGADKEKIGLAAAAIRRLRPPEPYKGKGIKYAEERIRKKAGKTGTK
ncbi:50S ribosomal subunit protein L6 [Candidatus Desulfarcum epimagneticum]|uniref:Large ribosomal subunit protein uL6 n=1 Tax=uncultured Desulfobacteraceae bacterium TaxID=218296 RepID=A0A484HHN5_9BACT|nr:50S ribosomal subunit protein L6 [uncultured Desulfobacteraceae bacterium]